MDLFKTSLIEITGGVFIGKVVDFFFASFTASQNTVTTGGVPKLFLEIVAETALLAFLSQQFMNWEWTNGYGGNQDLFKLFYVIGIFISTTNYIKRIRLLTGWIQSWTTKEISFLNTSLQDRTPLSNPMLTLKEPKGIFDTPVAPTEQSMRDINFSQPIKLD